MGGPVFPNSPGEAATLLEVVGIDWVVRVGFALDLNVAFNLGAGHPIEFKHFALSIGQTDGDAKVPTGGVPGGVSSFNPAPELIPDAVIHFLKGPFGGSISVVVGPTLQERVEFAKERLLAEAQGGLNAAPDFVPAGLDVALGRVGQEFISEFAHGVPQKVEALIGGSDDGLLL